MAIQDRSGNPKILAAQFRIKHKDIFNAEQLYKWIHEWIKENEWRDVQDSTMGDRHESFYMDKTGLYGDKELWMWWRLWMFPDGFIGNSFYKLHLDLDFHFIYLRDTETMFKGKKVKTNDGELELKVWAWIEMDYKGEWSRHPILRFFLETFRLRIFYTELLRLKYQLNKEMNTLQERIKRYLQLKLFLPQIEGAQPFHSERGVPKAQY